MKKLFLIVLSAVLTLTLTASTFGRTWTDRKGRQVEGDFLEFKEGKVGIKRSTDGKVFEIPLELLSDADQAYIKSQADPTHVANDEATAGDQVTTNTLRRVDGMKAACEATRAIATMETISELGKSTGGAVGVTVMRVAVDRAYKEAGLEKPGSEGMVARGAAMRTKAAKKGSSLSLVEGCGMASQAMVCRLFGTGRTQRDAKANEELLDELIAGAVSLQIKAAKKGSSLRIVAGFGMASQAMVCDFLGNDRTQRDVKAYDELLDELIAGAVSLQTKAAKKGSSLRIVEGFGMASQAMVCRLSGTGQTQRDAKANEELLDELIAGAASLQTKAAKKGSSLRIVETFGMASQAMVCDLLRNDRTQRDAKAYDELMDELIAGAASQQTKAAKEGRGLSIGKGFGMAVKERLCKGE